MAPEPEPVPQAEAFDETIDDELMEDWDDEEEMSQESGDLSTDELLDDDFLLPQADLSGEPQELKPVDEVSGEIAPPVEEPEIELEPELEPSLDEPELEPEIDVEAETEGADSESRFEAEEDLPAQMVPEAEEPATGGASPPSPAAPASRTSTPAQPRRSRDEAGLLDYLSTLTQSLPEKKRSEFLSSKARLRLEYVKARLRGVNAR